MSLVGKIIRRPVSALIFVILLVMFGLFTATQLSLDFFPDVESYDVTVITNYPGASPEEVEENVSKPLEETIRGLENLEKVSSVSSNDISIVQVTFKYGSGIDQNVNYLRERIDRVRAMFPDDVDDPTIFRFSTDDIPIMEVGVVSNRSINDARDFFDNELLVYFEQIDGVARIGVAGGDTKQVYVEPSIDRLNAFNLTLSDISTAISTNGERSSVGFISTEVSDIGLVVDNNYEDLETLENLVIVERTSKNGESYFVRLRDVADITFGYGDPDTISLLNDRPAILINFYKLADTNIVQVADNIKKMLKSLERTVPSDFEFVVVEDQSVFIRENLVVVAQAMLSGAILAILVLMFFLRNITSVLVVMISMPISIILTLMLMYFANMTINFMSLSGLALGIGMLVDNSIVVLEHIYNKRLRGVKLLSASEYGASEMARPIFASTLTTILVFAPLLLFKNELGMIGGFFTALVFTIVISVISSYCVAAFFLPVLTSKYFPLYRANPKRLLKKIDSLISKGMALMERAYYKSIAYALKRRKRFIVLILGGALLPLLAIPRLGFSFAPDFAPESIEVVFDFPSTAKLEEMNTVINDFEERTRHFFDVSGVKFKTVRINGRTAGGGLFSKSSRGTLAVYYLNDINQTEHKKIISELITYRNIYPGVMLRIRGGGQHRGPGGSDSAFSLDVKSTDYDKLLHTVSVYTKLLKENMSELTNIETNQENSSLEYSINIDTARANSDGVSVTQIVNELTTAVRGKTMGKYNEEAREYNIRLRLNEDDRIRSDIADRLYINTSRGTRIPLTNILSRSFDQGLEEIRREDFQRTITISADLIGKYTVGEAVADARRLIETYPQDENVSYFFVGEYEDIRENFSVLGWIFILAVLFVYGIMASQFESFLDPFIIIFTVPLTFAGVIFIYFVTANTVSSFTIVGIIMLVGIAVNHGIVLVDYINLLRKRGIALEDAVLDGARSRLQPILMTTLTTILGLLPITLSTSNGVGLVKPLSLTVIGGLSVSALLSLYYIPLLYVGYHRRARTLSSKRKVKRAKKEEYTALYASVYQKKI